MAHTDKIGILGTGAFGLALAVSIGQEQPLLLFGRDHADVTQMNKTRSTGKRLPGHKIPDTVSLTTEINKIRACDVILLAVPMKSLIETVKTLNPDTDTTLIACCKGLDPTTGMGPASLLKKIHPKHRIGLLSGPGFAKDIITHLPTAQSLSLEDDKIGAYTQQLLSTPTLRLYLNTDLRGTELGGALKNVAAIGCGAAIGAGMGESARASLLTRAFGEMMLLSTDLGGQPETMLGMAGFGDLVLTCTGPQSRNYQYGLSLGKKEKTDTTKTVEGIRTALAIENLTKQGEILPTFTAIAALCKGKPVAEIATILMERPLKTEHSDILNQ